MGARVPRRVRRSPASSWRTSAGRAPGRRLIAVRTNERAAASLGISVFGVKLYAFWVAAAIAGLAGILLGFQLDDHHLRAVQPVPVDLQRRLGGHRRPRVRRSAPCSPRPNAIGGLGTRIMEDVLAIGEWDAPRRRRDPAARSSCSTRTASPRSRRTALRPLFQKLHLVPRDAATVALAERAAEPVAPATLAVEHLTVRFGGVVAVDDASFEVNPGEVVGLDRSQRRRQDHDHRRGHRVRAARRAASHPRRATASTGGRRPNGPVAGCGARSSRSSCSRTSASRTTSAPAPTPRSRASWITDLFWPGKHALPSTAVAAIHEFELGPHLHQVPGRAARTAGDGWSASPARWRRHRR